MTSPSADAEPGEGGDTPLESVVSVIGSWVLMGLVLGALPLFAAYMRLTDLVQYARSRHGPAGTVTIADGTCDYDDNYSVVCTGTFHPADGGRPDHQVTVLTDSINPHDHLGVRLSTPTSSRAWADDYHPSWISWLIFALIFGSLGTWMLVFVSIMTRNWRRARRNRAGSPG
jgi:4-amino-4-deoxy-L-arabinose transferase-like glycosyltransferase